MRSVARVIGFCDWKWLSVRPKKTVAALPNLIGPEEIHPDVRWSWATVKRFWEEHYSTPLPKTSVG